MSSLEAGWRGLWLICTWTPTQWDALDLLPQGHSILGRGGRGGLLHGPQGSGPPRLVSTTGLPLHPCALKFSYMPGPEPRPAEAQRSREAHLWLHSQEAPSSLGPCAARHVSVHRDRSDGPKEGGGWNLAESQALCSWPAAASAVQNEPLSSRITSPASVSPSADQIYLLERCQRSQKTKAVKSLCTVLTQTWRLTGRQVCEVAQGRWIGRSGGWVCYASPMGLLLAVPTTGAR